MNNNQQKNTKENIADKSAIEEKNFTACDLLQEIIPLIKDYFIGSFEIESNSISMQFLNGQKFRLTAGEVV